MSRPQWRGVRKRGGKTEIGKEGEGEKESEEEEK